MKRGGQSRLHAPTKEFAMDRVDLREIGFQCPSCGQDLRQTLGRLKANEHMVCAGCHIGINIDTGRLANAAQKIHRAIAKDPPEITIKFFR
jgi:hypothetical protein